MSGATVLAIASAVLAISLFPAVLNRHKFPLASSLPSAIGVSGMLCGDLLLALWGAAAMAGLTAGCWWVLVLRGSP